MFSKNSGGLDDACEVRVRLPPESEERDQRLVFVPGVSHLLVQPRDQVHKCSEIDRGG